MFDRIIKNGQLSESESGIIISHCLTAIKYLHKLGIVHRNIRPETILFESENGTSDIKFADMITCIELINANTTEDEKNLDFILRSSPLYRSPEIIIQKR